MPNAYLYSGYKWGSYPVSVDVSDATFPISWASSVANSMTTWNNASSPFYFNSGSSGNKLKCANNGIGNPIALTTTTANGTTIVGATITFNTSYTWSTSGGASAYDVQNATTHELGHWLRLLDLYSAGDSEKTMYGYANTGETKKRTLDNDDINGINAIYP